MTSVSARAAWGILAEAFEGAPIPCIYGKSCYGICDAIHALWDAGRIREPAARRMMRAVTRHVKYEKGFYIWPIGSPKRALFCRMQMRVKCKPLKN